MYLCRIIWKKFIDVELINIKTLFKCGTQILPTHLICNVSLNLHRKSASSRQLPVVSPECQINKSECEYIEHNNIGMLNQNMDELDYGLVECIGVMNWRPSGPIDRCGLEWTSGLTERWWIV